MSGDSRSQPGEGIEGNGAGRTRTADARFRKPLPGVQPHLAMSISAQNFSKIGHYCLLLTIPKDVN
jgi:hypothetical protein